MIRENFCNSSSLKFEAYFPVDWRLLIMVIVSQYLERMSNLDSKYRLD